MAKAPAKAKATAGLKARAKATGKGPGRGTAPGARMSLAEVMATLEKKGTAQARKIYARHGAPGPMFGVSFADLKVIHKRIGVDHDLALALWETGNFDARNLACKIVDPSRMTPRDLDRWAGANMARMCGGYVAAVAAEGAHGPAKADQWLGAKEGSLRTSGWLLVGQLAAVDETMPDSWFEARLGRIEKAIHGSPNDEREAMNQAVIRIGGRSGALRRAAVAAARRIGQVEIDHGETSCRTPDAAEYIEKMWARCDPKRFASPSAQERARESMRTRC